MTIMVIVNAIWAFVMAHGHKVISGIALLLALHNKWQHSNLVKAIVQPDPTPAPTPVPAPVAAPVIAPVAAPAPRKQPKSKKSKSSKSKK